MNPNASNADRILHYPSDIAFTPTVKAMQERLGSRELYASVERDHAWGVALTPKIQEFIGAQTSVFLGTANTEGQPYIQHRGGPAGFLHVVDEHTIAFADFIGNQQYITLGNLADNPKAHLFVIDYARRRRVKIWGRARVIEDPALLAELMPVGYKARAERVIVFTVHAWDMNCPQHIPQRFEAAEVKSALDEREARIRELEEAAAQREARVRELEAEVARLREGAAV
ncbi:pyridoxamine 5'-phosphate oxidase family protein [Paraburkholderia sp. CNPSo 3274]|uniref:pyridoxamine 5'-phosphate oxidase family protein n=1 Tax=Paraburkholderia sp. CNPSo 3274 TaxID=2940932 RepID=UPI0020B8B8C7|nr:pyridoxamine 5'-phosphate oxidase family protein [Paraburkholderia sp. CNPSo 3274]MCP3709177.1 pyridoxamine 5'-phosphate oxidase family protein [Paraburkholderia sp. CNPSo 3274]